MFLRVRCVVLLCLVHRFISDSTLALVVVVVVVLLLRLLLTVTGLFHRLDFGLDLITERFRHDTGVDFHTLRRVGDDEGRFARAAAAAAVVA